MFRVWYWCFVSGIHVCDASDHAKLVSQMGPRQYRTRGALYISVTTGLFEVHIAWAHEVRRLSTSVRLAHRGELVASLAALLRMGLRLPGQMKDSQSGSWNGIHEVCTKASGGFEDLRIGCFSRDHFETTTKRVLALRHASPWQQIPPE